MCLDSLAGAGLHLHTSKLAKEARVQELFDVSAKSGLFSYACDSFCLTFLHAIFKLYSAPFFLLLLVLIPFLPSQNFSAASKALNVPFEIVHKKIS